MNELYEITKNRGHTSLYIFECYLHLIGRWYPFIKKKTFRSCARSFFRCLYFPYVKVYVQLSWFILIMWKTLYLAFVTKSSNNIVTIDL